MSDGLEGLSEREEIEVLLPWYVTGKLHRAERDRVAAYLAAHPDMRSQLALIGEERGESRRANEAIAAPGGASQARLMAKARTDESFGFARELWRKIEEFFAAPSPSAVRWGFAIATVLVVAQAGFIGALVLSRQNAAFETAAGPSASAADGAFALVRFAETAPLGAISDALAKLEVSIVEGPKPGGVFKVRLGPSDMPQAARNERITALRDRADIVKFVLPGS